MSENAKNSEEVVRITMSLIFFSQKLSAMFFPKMFNKNRRYRVVSYFQMTIFVSDITNENAIV